MSLSELYKNLFSSEKISKNSKILILNINDDDEMIKHNQKIINNMKLDILYHNINEFISFSGNRYDIIIFNNIFSSFTDEIIKEKLILYKNFLNTYGIMIFINELAIYDSQITYHPISCIRNLFFHLPLLGVQRILSLDYVYEFLRNNELNVIDSTRIYSNSTIPTYPVEYFSIICKFR